MLCHTRFRGNARETTRIFFFPIREKETLGEGTKIDMGSSSNSPEAASQDKTVASANSEEGQDSESSTYGTAKLYFCTY